MTSDTDYDQPGANVNGQAAASALALVTGHGPTLPVELEGFTLTAQDSTGNRHVHAENIAAGTRDLVLKLR